MRYDTKEREFNIKKKKLLMPRSHIRKVKKSDLLFVKDEELN